MGEMPWQLKYAKRPKRSEPRPIVESLPSINVNDLKIPRSYDTLTLPNIGLRYPQLASMRLTYHSAEVTHCTGSQQTPERRRYPTPTTQLQHLRCNALALISLDARGPGLSARSGNS